LMFYCFPCLFFVLKMWLSFEYYKSLNLYTWDEKTINSINEIVLPKIRTNIMQHTLIWNTSRTNYMRTIKMRTKIMIARYSCNKVNITVSIIFIVWQQSHSSKILAKLYSHARCFVKFIKCKNH
jgi:hypothetical protein